MFAGVIDVGNLDCAFDLMNRLQLEKRFEIALTISATHRQRFEVENGVKGRRFLRKNFMYIADDADDNRT